jgi:Spy/CpxP family protein refolding chaperone
VRTKVTVLVLLVMGLCLSLALNSSANPWEMKAHGGHRGQWGKFAKLTPEQAGKLFDLRQKFLDDTASLRKEMMVKRAELRALWQADNPDEKQILAKLKEINAAKGKIQEKAVPFRIEARKILPKEHDHQGRVSMEDDEMNLGPMMAREGNGPNDPGW